MDKRINALVDDYFYNRIPANEVKKIVEYLAGNPGDLDELMKKHWLENSELHMPGEDEFNVILDKIHHSINRINEYEDRLPLRERGVKGSGSLFIKRLMRVAAVLLLPLMIASAFYFSQHPLRRGGSSNIAVNEIRTPLSARTSFLLPDSSMVWLNAGSSLTYPMKFTGRTREVFLTGEGYFDVAKNPKVPFIVKTNNINVRAIGTKFNVAAYPDEHHVTTTLISGKVRIEDPGDGTYLYLNPSDQVVLDIKTGRVTVSEVDTRFYTSWKDGKLIFKNEPLELVAKKLERWFNCTIYIKDDQLKKFRYTGNIEMETLRELLDLIKYTTPVNYTYKKETREIWLEVK